MTVVRFEAGEKLIPESIKRLKKAFNGAGVKFSRQAGRVGVTVPDRDCKSDPL